MRRCDEEAAAAQTRACTGAGRESCHGPGERCKPLNLRAKASIFGHDTAALSRASFEQELARMTRELLRFASHAGA